MAKEIRVALKLDTSQFDRGIAAAQSKVSGFASGAVKEFDLLKSAVAGVFGAVAITSITKYADQYTNLQNKLINLYDTQTQANKAFEDVKKIAEGSRSAIGDVADLYTKLTISGRAAGISQAEVAQMTETFTKALKLSGATTTEASSAILQFGQAMASGKVQGDEFRSLMENSPIFMQKLSGALGLSIGKLRELSSEGMLTADVVRAAMAAIAPEVENEFDRTTGTVGESFVYLQNKFIEMLGTIEDNTGVFSGLAEIIRLLADNIQSVGLVIGIAFGAATARMVYNFVKAIGALNVVTRAQAVLQATVLAMSGPAGWAALAAGAAAAAAAVYGINKALETNVAKERERQKLNEAEAKEVEQKQQAARALLEQTIKQKAAEKESAKAAKDAAREAKRRSEEIRRGRERELKAANESIANFKTEMELSQKRFQLEKDAIGLSQTQKQINQDQLELERKYKQDIDKINESIYLTDEQRATAAGRLTELYNKERAAIAERNRELFKAQAADQSRQTVAGIGIDLETFKQQLSDLQQSRQLFNDQERAAFEDRASIEREFYDRSAKLKVQYKDQSDEELQILLANLETEKAARIEASRVRAELLKKDAEAQNTFAAGFEQAMGRFTESVRNNAEYGKRIFETLTQGFTDAIVKFAETGKLSFKDLFRSLMTEIIKMQANKLFLSIFGKGGPLSSLFAGFFAGGGMIPSGKYGIAGEAGPELIRGPANVIGTTDTAQILSGSGAPGRATVINYNINAVDAMSFKQMVARDPEFIYSVTQLGARRLPR